MTKTKIDQKYITQANQLEAEFFDVIDEGLPSQHLILKAGKIIEEFNQRQGKIWRNHEAELIAGGFMEAPIPPEPTRDLAKEIDALKTEVAKEIDTLKAQVADFDTRLKKDIGGHTR